MSAHSAATVVDPPLSLAALPSVLFDRCAQYTAAPVDSHQYLRRHADMPSVFRNGVNYLWDAPQVAAVNNLFPVGWLANSNHPFQLCTGQVRFLRKPDDRQLVSLANKTKAGTQVQLPVDDDQAFSRTIKEQMDSRNFSTTARPFVISDISPYATTASSLAFAPLALGPQLFSTFNLLTATPTSSEAHDHTLAQLNIAMRGTHTNTHTDWYGADAVAQLVQGEKLWLMAPPEDYQRFQEIFPETLVSFELTGLNLAGKKVDTLFQQLAALPLGCAVHQHAGDIITVPAGWVHAVVNLTETVSFGYSYLRPWKLHSCLEWAKERGKESALSLVNLHGVFDQTLVNALPPPQVLPTVDRPFWGISPAQIQKARASWNALVHSWHLAELEEQAKEKLAQGESVLAGALASMRND